MTSCRILSWDRLNTVYPARLAGTCSRYSNSAMPQLTKAAIHQGLSARFFRWAYQAKVMNMLEATSSRTVFTTGSTRSLSGSTDCGPFQSGVDQKARAYKWDQ